MVLVWFVNFWGARAYGEAEFWFSSIKVITIVGLIILGVILMAGGGPDHDPIGFRYWIVSDCMTTLNFRAGGVDIFFWR